ncbi:MGMT family protein [Candidatus Methylacidithermus pantelleriae]|uniref:Putative Methylated-DNA--(Protein)-cysteine S-methyltransferase n=1 Tax=Candidatus Methylacidithermus pantelleriae TaxID=2744239 RepID=A0A8J2BQF3_9BACT|nr:putative Methylated-DNA--(protein)-cysteine S-methyltransferase [Candidatus Methylacidithermus pantelleriae]
MKCTGDKAQCLDSFAHLTSWQKRVYSILQRIPRGHVATYGELARALGVRSPRAVGQALKANPLAPMIPCHRVVGHGGSLVGYQGSISRQALERKRKLLEKEGVRFTPEGKVDPTCFVSFDKLSTKKPGSSFRALRTMR